MLEEFSVWPVRNETRSLNTVKNPSMLSPMSTMPHCHFRSRGDDLGAGGQASQQNSRSWHDGKQRADRNVKHRKSWTGILCVRLRIAGSKTLWKIENKWEFVRGRSKAEFTGLEAQAVAILTQKKSPSFGSHPIRPN
jgi:hypothetical protein